MKSPIKYLLVSTNQTFSGYLICLHYRCFDTAKYTNTHEIKPRRPRSQILIFLIFPVLFSRNFIDEECENRKTVTDVGEITRNIKQKKKPDILQAYVCPLCDKCCRREYLFNKHVEYCESLG